jgi:hypothetical protein
MSILVVTMVTFSGLAPASADSNRIGNDASSTSWYPDQPLLTPSAVATGGSFGQIFDSTLSGMIYAQPLVSDGVLLAVTENDVAYGLDASTGATIWSDSFTPTATPAEQVSGNTTTTCGDIGPSIGITSTPVIDSSAGVAYFVAARASGAGGATQYWMEAVDVATGQPPSFWPAGGVLIQGHADNDTGTTFNAPYETQRPGLVLVNGVVYAAFSAQCDFIPPTGTYAGWLVGVNATSGAITTMWASEIHGNDGAGIWQSGAAPVVDSQGNIYLITGNGWANNTLPTPGPGTRTISYFGEAVVELSTSSGILTPVDWFIPQDGAALNSGDLDFGSGGPVALPASMGTSQQPSVLLGVGKEGTLYSMDMANLGGFQDGPNLGDNVPFETNVGGGVWGKPAVWPGDGGYIYLPVTGSAGNQTSGTLEALQRVVSAAGAVGFKVVGTSGASTMGFTTGSPIVTSNQSDSGSSLVWVVHADDESGSGGQLDAYDPIPQNPGVNGTLTKVWSSSTFSAEKYTEPGVGNAMIYVGTRDGHLLGFGFGSAAPVMTGNNVDFPETVVSQSSTLTATFTATAPTTVESFARSGSAYAIGSSTPATPASLSTGQSITVPVTFTPSAFATSTGTLTANTITAGTMASTTAVNLSGVGLGASTVVASPLEADFSAQTIGGPMVSIPVTMTNTTAGPINITGFVAPLTSTPFSVTGAPSAQTLASNASVSFSVNFSPPSSSGNYAHVYGSVATLETSIGDFGVPLSGSADPSAQLALVSSPLDFGTVRVGRSTTSSFLVENNGALPLTISSSTPPRGNGFSPTTSLAVGTQIPANSSVSETVEFAPTSAGVVSASWSITSDAGSQTLAINATGIDVPGAPTNVVASAGDASASVSWSPPSSNGASAITQYTVTATDTTSSGGGGQTCSPLSGQTTCALQGLANGDVYTFSVVATNLVGNSLASASSNSVSPGVVAPPGTGPSSIPPPAPTPPASAQLSISPSSLDFGDVPIGQSRTLNFTIANLGGEALTIESSQTPQLAVGFSATSTLPVGTVIPGGSSLQETVTFSATTTSTGNDSWVITGNDGQGARSLSLSGTGVVSPASAPRDVSAVAGDASANVTWASPSFDGGGPVDSYSVTTDDQTTGARGAVSCAPATGLTCTLKGLSNGDRYSFSVAALNSAGVGTSSAASNVVTPGPPGLVITTHSGRAGVALPLASSGDPLGGATSYYVVDGTARGCRIVTPNATLRSLSGGTCVVVAFRAASANEPAVMSGATIVTMTGSVPGPHYVLVTVSFASANSSLSGRAQAILTAWAKSLSPNAVVTITGFAQGHAALATARVTEVSKFLSGLARVRVQFEYVTSVAKDFVTIGQLRP